MQLLDPAGHLLDGVREGVTQVEQRALADHGLIGVLVDEALAAAIDEDSAQQSLRHRERQHDAADVHADGGAAGPDAHADAAAVIAVGVPAAAYLSLLPRAAALLDAGMLSDVIELRQEGDDLTFKRVMFAGNVIATVQVDSAAVTGSVGFSVTGATATIASVNVSYVPLVP